MQLLADLHTHTIASGHAYSTVTENARVAAAKGLELIGIMDHGPAVPQGQHPWYFWNLKVLPSVLDGVRILKGCEANPQADSVNGLDLPDDVLSGLDFVAVGFHPHVGFDDRDRARNTDALLRVMANPLLDMVAHPGNEADFPLDIDAVVEAAVAYNVILELNNHSFDPMSARAGSVEREREFAAAAFAAGAPMAVGSDAHYALHIGGFDEALECAADLGIAAHEFVNFDAETTLHWLTSKRERPRLDAGGAWVWPDSDSRPTFTEALADAILSARPGQDEE